MIRAGYSRLTPRQRSDAVRWWFYLREGDFEFARGGLVDTARTARNEIRIARQTSDNERAWHKKRPTHRLASDGCLDPVVLVDREVLRA